MRNPPNETPLGSGSPAQAGAQDGGGTGPRPAPGNSHVPERKCILSGEHAARDDLIRLALSPEGETLPDVRAKAPGRGAWIGVDRAALEQAQAKGKLRGALARAFKAGELAVPTDLAERVEAALRQ
ncbi:MAG TPA: YlxR family protein, partial [Allosphingosinicella sp.]|nr:YlxR family protein [Allosphingosinicella sp.]